jgi:hypothetical protein
VSRSMVAWIGFIAARCTAAVMTVKRSKLNMVRQADQPVFSSCSLRKVDIVNTPGNFAYILRFRGIGGPSTEGRGESTS